MLDLVTAFLGTRLDMMMLIWRQFLKIQRGIQWSGASGVVESLKIITHQAGLRVAEYAFLYAKTHGRERVSAIRKANIMKLSDGLFLKLVKNPTLFDVLVMPNVYGDIISDLCAGLIGGLGLNPSMNIGDGGMALAEAVHGSAPDIAGKNLANPPAHLLSGVEMMRHVKLRNKAELINSAILKTIAEGKHRTVDLGGSASTTKFTDAVCENL